MSDFEPSVKSVRRYYLLKARTAWALGDQALAAVWQGKQEAVASTALPDDFPSRAELVAAGYSTSADLDGANIEELRSIGLGVRQAEAVFAALAAL